MNDKYYTRIHVLTENKNLTNENLADILINMYNDILVNDDIKLEELYTNWTYDIYNITKINDNNEIDIMNYTDKNDKIKNDIINYIVDNLRKLNFNLEIFWDNTIDKPEDMTKPE